MGRGVAVGTAKVQGKHTDCRDFRKVYEWLFCSSSGIRTKNAKAPRHPMAMEKRACQTEVWVAYASEMSVDAYVVQHLNICAFHDLSKVQKILRHQAAVKSTALRVQIPYGPENDGSLLGHHRPQSILPRFVFYRDTLMP